MTDAASGVRFLAGFGGLWCVVACGALLGDAGTPIGLIVGAVVAFGLVIAHGRAVAQPHAAPRRNVQAAFRRVGFTQAAAIGAAVILGTASGHQEWITALVCLVVGAHFLPLAAIFGVRRYRLTAAAMLTAALATLATGALTRLSDNAWVALPAAGACIALWATAASMILEPRRSR
jgi:hypothetical protein